LIGLAGLQSDQIDGSVYYKFRKRLTLHRLQTVFALFSSMFEPNHRNYNPDQTAKLLASGAILIQSLGPEAGRDGGWNKATILVLMQGQPSRRSASNRHHHHLSTSK